MSVGNAVLVVVVSGGVGMKNSVIARCVGIRFLIIRKSPTAIWMEASQACFDGFDIFKSSEIGLENKRESVSETE